MRREKKWGNIFLHKWDVLSFWSVTWSNIRFWSVTTAQQQQCFLSVAVNKHLHSIFTLCPAQRHFYLGVLWTLETIVKYLKGLFSFCFCDGTVEKEIGNVGEREGGDMQQRKWFIGLNVAGIFKWFNSYQSRHSGIISLRCDWMEMTQNYVKSVPRWQTLWLSDFNCTHNKSWWEKYFNKQGITEGVSGYSFIFNICMHYASSQWANSFACQQLLHFLQLNSFLPALSWSVSCS